MARSEERRLIETIKGIPTQSDELHSQQTMDGIVFSPDQKYIVFLYDNNYVGVCGGSAKLDAYKSPHKNKDDAYLEKIRELVRRNAQQGPNNH